LFYSFQFYKIADKEKCVHTDSKNKILYKIKMENKKREITKNIIKKLRLTDAEWSAIEKKLKETGMTFSKFALSIDETVAKALALEAGWSLEGAELDNKNGLWVYEVELERGISEKKVIINAQTGEIIGNYTK